MKATLQQKAAERAQAAPAAPVDPATPAAPTEPVAAPEKKWLYVNSWGRDKTQIIGLCRRETLRHDFYV